MKDYIGPLIVGTCIIAFLVYMTIVEFRKKELVTYDCSMVPTEISSKHFADCRQGFKTEQCVKEFKEMFCKPVKEKEGS